MLKEGIMYRVGNGRTIDIWRDPWVGDEGGRYIEIEAVDGLNVSGRFN